VRRFISIREKLVLFFILLGIVSIGITSYLSYSNARSAILSRTFDQLTSLRIEKKKQIELFFSERKKDLFLLVQDESINSFSYNNEQDFFISDSSAFSEHALKILNSSVYSGIYIFYPETNSIKYLSLSNKRTDQSNILSANSLLSIITKDSNNLISISDYNNRTKQMSSNSVFVKTYIKKNKYWVVLPVKIDAINKIMYENNPYNGLGKTGEAYLVGNDSLMRSTSRFNENSVYKIKVNSLSVQNAFKGITNTIIIYDYRKIKVISSFDKITSEGLNWVILAEMDWDEVLIPVYKFRNNILFVSIIISGLFILISYIVSLGITRAIVKLNSAVSEVGKGNFNVNIEISTNDEIGELTRSFNKMASQLKLSSKQLEEERINRTRSMIDGQEIERLRLSRELHDGLGQQMIGLRLKIENLANRCEGNTGIIAAEVGKLMDKTIEEVRRMSNDLMPAVLQEFGVANAIRNLCDQITDASTLKINIQISGNYDLLTPKEKTYLFRIVQEALNNIVKHAKASDINMQLSQNNSNVLLEVSDNGKGCNFDNKNNDSHNGINNMKERANLLNGNLNIESFPGMGTKVVLTFPLNDEKNTSNIS
jgi:signal transduction histidine kinase